MTKVVLYTRTICMPCRMTKRRLTELGIDFEELNVDENPHLKEEIHEMGFMSAPVVVFGDGEDERFAGFNVPRIEALAERIRAEKLAAT